MPIALAVLAGFMVWAWFADKAAAAATAAANDASSNLLAAQAVQAAAAQMMVPGLTGYSGSVITLMPDYPQMLQIGAAIGDSVTIALPPGAKWAGGGTYQPQGASTPIEFTYQGPGAVQQAWQNFDGSMQVSNLSFYTISR